MKSTAADPVRVLVVEDSAVQYAHLVRTLEDGLRRIREHSLPLESERTQRVYGQPSAINKLLIVNGEAYPGRITIVLVKLLLGF